MDKKTKEALIERIVERVKKELEEDIANFQQKNDNSVGVIKPGINLGITDLE